VALSFVIYHLASSISFERDESIRSVELTRRVRDAIMQLNVNEAALPGQDLVLLAAPEVGTSMYLPLTRRRYGRSAPRATWYLSLAPAPYVLTRTAPDAFTMRYTGTATLLETMHEQILRSPRRPLRVGDVVDLGRFRTRILELFEGRPRLVAVQFDRPLEDRSLLFMTLTERGYQRTALPRVGTSMVVSAPILPNPAVVHDGHGR
jgi:hypothetical protein